ncbi:unnamed protein product, partial [Candidula unifasciata]
GSPLAESGNVCPRGWHHYHHFCVTQGDGSTEKAVALYCGGLGGIGVNGLCIITPNNLEPASENDPNYATVAEDNGQQALYRDSQVSSNFVDTDILGDPEPVESRLCPKGWTHYNSMCVYRPWSLEERCSLLGAVEFRGLCIK